MSTPLRFGILGAARIAPGALIKPARSVQGALVLAVAARNESKARGFARKYNLPRVLNSYDALVNDPDLDAIYNPLPNSLHFEWTIKALRAGKHVLCEKPLSANAREAEEMTRAAGQSGRVLMEAFHYRYHPLARRVEEILASGEIGAVREIEADFFIPLYLRPRDIRFQYALAGGATMDTGCYCVNLIRWLGGGEPRTLRAEARRASESVDNVMRAEFEFDNGVRARMGCSLAAFPPVKIFARVRGTSGELRITNPFTPHFYNWLDVRTPRGKRRERLTREPTYNFQLRAFLAATHGESTNITDGAEGLKNMRVIDSIYEKAGMMPRGT
jgi:predicted dehydrogenase